MCRFVRSDVNKGRAEVANWGKMNMDTIVEQDRIEKQDMTRDSLCIVIIPSLLLPWTQI